MLLLLIMIKTVMVMIVKATDFTFSHSTLLIASRITRFPLTSKVRKKLGNFVDGQGIMKFPDFP